MVLNDVAVLQHFVYQDDTLCFRCLRTNTVVHSGEVARCKEAITEGTNRGAAVEGLPYQLQSTLQQCLVKAAELPYSSTAWYEYEY